MTDNRYAAFDFYDRGEREHMEDRSRVDQITTVDNRMLQVAIVCDGVGGVNRGEIAAQAAIDTALHYLATNPSHDMIALLEGTVAAANAQVIHVGHGGKCTFALAIIVEDGSRWGRLYIASVGDSPIVLVRKGKLNRLNRDHNIAAEAILNDGMQPELAYSAPNAHHLTRALGVRPDVQADTGFYTNAPSEAVGLARGRKGLELEEADTIYVMSDGMIDTSPIDLNPCVREEEFVRHALDRNPESTARLLVSFAMGRRAQDNVSLALIFVAPNSKARHNTIRGRGGRIVFGALAMVAAVALFLFFMFINTSDELGQASDALTIESERREQAEAEGTRAALVVLESTQIAASWTETPTPTLTPTHTPLPRIEEGDVGVLYQNQAQTLNPRIGQTVEAHLDGVFNLFADPDAGPEAARIYMMSDSMLRVESVDSNRRRARLLSDTGRFLIQPEAIYGGISIQFTGTTIGIQVMGTADGQNGCIGVEHDEQRIAMTCYAGECSVTTTIGGQETRLDIGQRLEIDSAGDAAQTMQSLSRVADEFADLLASVAGRNSDDYRICNLARYISPPPPTATPLPTNTPPPTPMPDQGGSQIEPPPEDSQPVQPRPTSVPPTSVPLTEETPTEETPTEETPTEETPAEETPAEETPAEETPAEETPTDPPPEATQDLNN